jgi:hypothetical protein
MGSCCHGVYLFCPNAMRWQIQRQVPDPHLADAEIVLAYNFQSSADVEDRLWKVRNGGNC